MRILGIQLTYPGTPHLLLALLVGGLLALFSAALTATGHLSATGGAMVAAAAVGGAMASAYGASIVQQGWRGLLVSNGISGLLAAAVYLLMRL